ncbi:MAG TPA: peptide chain release factor H [Desulfuromonadales bacterium]|nr:peptide chain release factor H [Desulfuromonadales bacterium]
MVSILLQITSGRGPVECCWVVARLAESLIAEARKQRLQAEIIETEAGGEKETLLSALIHLDGEGAEGFVASYEGTIQWIGNSPFRPDHKRKNWFVGTQQLPMPESVPLSELDLRIETMKAGGPGGQHVNTTESAVRVVHIPTGLIAMGRDVRSQNANRKRALERLSILVARHRQRQMAKVQKQRWDAHNELVRGNPVRVYKGKDFLLK